MKKAALSAFVIFTFIAYAIHDHVEGSSIQPVTPVPQPMDTSTSGISSALPVPSPTQPSGSISRQNGYTDGTYTGNVADAYYGNVQVQVTVSGGRISDVQFLDYPHDRRTSEFINSQAMPYLKQEAIQAQTAQVDIVSGATATSRAFIESLQTALSKASA